MRLPDFLIIGAMKSATTGVYRDLNANPEIFFPSIKEPACLIKEQVLTPKGRKAYAAFFSRARPEQTCGEATTLYTKLPDIQGVPRRALQVIGPNVKLIYVVREPVDRAISHHYHLFREQRAPIDINEAVHTINELIDYGRYAMQLEPWLETFGRENLLIVRMEDYADDRLMTVKRISEFLGVQPRPDLIEVGKRHNVGTTTGGGVGTILRKPINAIKKSTFYRTRVHPRTPTWLREAGKKLFVRKSMPKPPPPSIETVEFIIGSVEEDATRLREIMRRDEPVWDFEEVRRHYLVNQGTTR